MANERRSNFPNSFPRKKKLKIGYCYFYSISMLTQVFSRSRRRKSELVEGAEFLFLLNYHSTKKKKKRIKKKSSKIKKKLLKFKEKSRIGIVRRI